MSNAELIARYRRARVMHSDASWQRGVDAEYMPLVIAALEAAEATIAQLTPYCQAHADEVRRVVALEAKVAILEVADCPYKAECDANREHVAPGCPSLPADLLAAVAHLATRHEDYGGCCAKARATLVKYKLMEEAK